MFTLARLWYLDCQTIFLYCNFFNGILLGLQDQYLAEYASVLNHKNQ